MFDFEDLDKEEQEEAKQIETGLSSHPDALENSSGFVTKPLLPAPPAKPEPPPSLVLKQIASPVPLKSSDSVQKFRVAAKGVFVRDRPDVKGARIGAFRQGAQISGVFRQGWLQLDEPSKRDTSVAASEDAFVLIDGTHLGLGVLLEEVRSSSSSCSISRSGVKVATFALG